MKLTAIRRCCLNALAAMALLLPAVPAAAGAPDVDFDRGVDAAAIFQDIREGLRTSPPGREPDFEADYRRTERDCATISFRRDDPLLSERILLESREYEERCEQYRDRDGRWRRWCREEWVWTERRRVRVRISGRGEMLPWERDVFTICLDGRWLGAWVEDASHDYDLDMPGWRGDTIEARAGAKIRSLPDAYGIQGTLRMDAGSNNFEMGIEDRWIEYYRGEKIEVKIKLTRHHKNWFDSTVLEKKITLPAAETNRIRIADYVADLTGELKPGKKYYVKWKFRRIGNVSRDAWLHYRETAKTRYEGPRIKPPPDPDDDWEDYARGRL